MPEDPTARRLLEAVASLKVTIERVDVHSREMHLPAYGDEPRPTSCVELNGAGCSGKGEHVGWTTADHQQFAKQAGSLPSGRRTLAEFRREISTTSGHPYDRAALESAALDLALHQNRISLSALAGRAHAPLRYVLSFAAPEHPVEAVRRWRHDAPGIGLKLDVDPQWPDETLAELHALGGIEILDSKGRGTARSVARLANAFPHSILEDPAAPEALPDERRARLSLDAAVAGTSPLAAIEELRPAWVNLKVPRMGSVLGLLEVAAACATRGIGFYFGGMFEVGVGRKQARSLASLLCPEASNDLGPIAGADPADFPAIVPAEQLDTGFGPSTGASCAPGS